jgi:hypothetical protein
VHADCSDSHSFGGRDIHRNLTLQQLVQLASHGSILSHRYEKDITYLTTGQLISFLCSLHFLWSPHSHLFVYLFVCQ